MSAVGLSAVLVPMTASADPAGVARPATPTGLKVVAATTHSITVAVNKTPHAKTYRLYASTTRSNLFYTNIKKAFHSPMSRKPLMTIGGLKYTTAPYYYRVEAINNNRFKFSDVIGEAGLRPPRPTGVVATASHSKSFLSWNVANGSGYQVERATNAAMSAHTHVNTMFGTVPQYTPYGVVKGNTYYFRVRTMNVETPSKWSPAVSMTPQVSQFDVRVMSYNVLEARFDGRQEGGNTVAPWSERKVAIVKTINDAHPDVIGLQEAATFVGGGMVRQADAIRNALSDYGLAQTEIPPGDPGWHRTANYILFNKATYAAVGTGGHWALGDSRWASYQLLKNRATNAKFLFVDAHLRVQPGQSSDVKRKHETETLLSDARGMASNLGVPVAYVGDFNSDQYLRHAFNGPLMVMDKAQIRDAYQVASKRTRGHYNTANHYLTRPPKTNAHIDYVFAPPGIGVRSWINEMRVAQGKFVGTIPSDHNALVSDLTIPYS
jgi:endonuclease/exonuclease/phosphatase family metal-dependent hydrolase